MDGSRRDAATGKSLGLRRGTRRKQRRRRGYGPVFSSKPLNNQNVTTYPLGKKRCSELGLRNVRVCVAPPAGRAMIVGDFSQAHMRFFAQVSQDEAPLEDFQAGRDAHIRLARDFYIAYRPDARYPKRASRSGARRTCRQRTPGLRRDQGTPRPRKERQLLVLNMGSAQKVRQIAETSPEPIHLPQTIDVGAKTATLGGRARTLARGVRDGLPVPEERHPQRGRQSHCFDFTDGEYGAGVVRRWQASPVPAQGVERPAVGRVPDDGRYSVKGTEALAGIMQMSEANALKMAAAFAVEQFDAHPEWEAFIFNIVHDELDAECAEAYRLEVARCIHESMQRGECAWQASLICPRAPRRHPEKLIVKSWADK